MSAASQLALALEKWAQDTQGRVGCALLIRHGATAWNTDGRLQGRVDVPLSEVGLQQVADTATFLAEHTQPAAVYTSPLQRAFLTGQAISKSTGAPLKVNDDITERAFGAMEGLTVDESNQQFPKRREDESTVPGMEAFAALQERADQSLSAILQGHSSELVVIVSHGGLINAFLAAVSDGEIGSGKTNLVNGGITVLWKNGGKWHLGAVNINDHITCPTGQTLQR